ncbi:MAG: hypothetical protein IJT82_00080, partial [Schwartzia sp.]|nr:hypothetical protein [Schwartzia sp. (in: firmicutes)]
MRQELYVVSNNRDFAEGMVVFASGNVKCPYIDQSRLEDNFACGTPDEAIGRIKESRNYREAGETVIQIESFQIPTDDFKKIFARFEEELPGAKVVGISATMLDYGL